MSSLDGPFRDPDIPHGERTEYRGTIDREPAGEGHLAVTVDDGRYSQQVVARLADGYEAELELRWIRRNGTLLADSYALDTRDGSQVVAREEGHFRDVRALGWGGELGTYPRNVTPLLGVALALRGMDFEAGERHVFAAWLANTLWWEVEAHVERREKVTVPAGAHDAWRVRVRPKFSAVAGALDSLMGSLMPPFVLHFAAEPPHRFLRFSFPTGPFPWNPRGRIEATALD